MKSAPPRDLVHNLFLPTLMFVALGGMGWAVRGCSGYGAAVGCIFTGVMWGAAWWFMAQGPGTPRRYRSGWIVLAVSVGMGIAGARGWMQWPAFFEGKFFIDASKGQFVPISRAYGFLWLFIAGMPWAGLAACMLAWCGPSRPLRSWEWGVRIACGLGGMALGGYLFYNLPQIFWPLYDTLEPQYREVLANAKIAPKNTMLRFLNDSGAAMRHLGMYFGFLGFELARREWKNSLLIATVGVVNGAGWSLLQNWKWAPNVWPTGNFNWWRCWESSGGLSIGLALGIAYYLVNRPMTSEEAAATKQRRARSLTFVDLLVTYLGLVALSSLLLLGISGYWGIASLAILAVFGWVFYRRQMAAASNSQSADEVLATGQRTLERFGLYLGLLFGLGISIRAGLKGWFNIYRGHEDYYSAQLWKYMGPMFLAILLGLCVQALAWPARREGQVPVTRHGVGLMWLTLLVQNVLAQLITGPLGEWNEAAFSIYYVLLFAVTAVIVMHYGYVNWRVLPDDEAPLAARV